MVTLPQTKIRTFQEVDPGSVLTEGMCLIYGLLTLGCPVLPAPWVWHEELREEIDGKVRRTLVFRFVADGKSADGVPLSEVINRWNDPAWLAAHPTDSITQVSNALRNAARLAGLIRSGNAAANLLRRGKKSVRIPVNASAEERERWLAQLAA